MKKLKLLGIIFFLIGLISCCTFNNSNKTQTQAQLQPQKSPQIEQLILPFDFATYTDVDFSISPESGVWCRAGDKEQQKECIKVESGKKIIDEIEYEVIKLLHNNDHDFSLTIKNDFAVTSGEAYLISANVHLTTGKLQASFVTYDKNKKVLNWNAGVESAEISSDYKTLYSLVRVDDEIAFIRPRFIGDGKTEAELLNISLKKVQLPDIEKFLSIENDNLKVLCNTSNLNVEITNKINSKVYKQGNSSITNYVVTKAEKSPDLITITTSSIKDTTDFIFEISLDSENPSSVNYSVNCKSKTLKPTEIDFTKNLNFPQKNISAPGDYLVLPINEGMCFDYDDSGMPATSCVTYSGHGLCMPFYGIASNDGSGFVNIIKTPDDASVRLSRDETNCVGVEWTGQKNKFGYERKMTQTFFTEGGHVAIAKNYREYAKKKGLVVTFDQKKQLRGKTGAENIEKLAGAANIWSSYYEWTNHTPENFVQSILDSGIDRILWSNKQSAKVVQNLNEKGVLTGRYDIYQDIMNPAYYDLVKYNHSDWLPEAYPQDIAINADGSMVRAWGVEKKDGPAGEYIYCNALCDMTAPKYARKKISEELSRIDFGARFLDTTTASSLRQCYSSAHPMTRTQSREARYELLQIVSEENNLICGSETGMDFCVPVCDYFEGMLSLGPYRIKDAGRNVDKIIDDVPSQIIEYQLNEKRRLPLWELVYHDCCVAMWYWGDFNNKLPQVWDKRDLFNALYAVPPMYWIHNEEFFAQNMEKFVSSYNVSAKIVAATFGVEMISHEFVSEDKSIQKVTFANGVSVTVDFNSGSVSAVGI